MLTLFHRPFCPHSRFVRLALSEAGLAFTLVEVRAGHRSAKFEACSPDGATPTLIDERGFGVPGEDVIVATLEETHAELFRRKRLLPSDPAERLEARRLTRWFNQKMHQGAARWILGEKSRSAS